MPQAGRRHSVDWICSFVLLAQDPQPDAGGTPFWVQMLPMVAIALLAYFMLFLPEKRKQEQLKRLQGVKETDHVITTGGIYGVVTNVQRDAGRVTLRVDDATGTKIKVSLAAIAQILSDESAHDADIVKDKSKT